MSLLITLIICLFVGLPIGVSFFVRKKLTSPSKDDPTIALYKDRLTKLEQDYNAQLIEPTHYQAAKLEIKRQLLDYIPTPPAHLTQIRKGHKLITAVSLLLIPFLALLLYALNGEPLLGPHPTNTIPPHAASQPSQP